MRATRRSASASAPAPAPRSRGVLIGGVASVIALVAASLLLWRAPGQAPPVAPAAMDTLGPLRDRVQALIDSGIANNASGEYLTADRWLDSAGRLAVQIASTPLVARADSVRRANASGCQTEASLRGGRGGALRCP